MRNSDAVAGDLPVLFFAETHEVIEAFVLKRADDRFDEGVSVDRLL